MKPPAAHRPDDQDFYVPDVQAGVHKPNVRLLREHFINEGRLTEQQAIWILDQTTTLLTQEPNMLQIDGPVTGGFPQSWFRSAGSLSRRGSQSAMSRLVDPLYSMPADASQGGSIVS